MHDTEEDDDAEEIEDLGPSLAKPPLYVLRSADRCPGCGQAVHVYALGCAAFRDAADSRPVDQFHFLRRITSLPGPVLTLLEDRCPGLNLDATEDGGPPYLMNHCRCGARLDDDFVNGDVGAAFWPDTPEGYGRFKLFRLPIETDIPIRCGYMIGGGEYLNVEEAERW